jgi:hypothetical protein
MACCRCLAFRRAFFDRLPARSIHARKLKQGSRIRSGNDRAEVFLRCARVEVVRAICGAQYTLPRDEAAIFAQRTGEFAREVGPGVTLIDLGAGNCEKAERLFELCVRHSMSP